MSSGGNNGGGGGGSSSTDDSSTDWSNPASYGLTDADISAPLAGESMSNADIESSIGLGGDSASAGAGGDWGEWQDQTPEQVLTPEELEAELERASNEAILASDPTKPSEYYGSSWNYNTLNKGLREGIYDATTPGEGSWMKKMGITGPGMSKDQFLSTETDEARDARMKEVSNLIGQGVNMVMPAQAKMIMALIKASQTGDIGAALGSFVGANSGVPLGAEIGTAVGRYAQTGAPPSLENMLNVVSSKAGASVMGKLGYGAGGTVGGMVGAKVGSNLGNEFSSWVLGGGSGEDATSKAVGGSTTGEKSTMQTGSAGSGGSNKGGLPSIMVGGRR
jgi:hypothetical protein